MSPRFLFLILSFTLLSGQVGATSVVFNDLNLVDRDISIYMVNDTGTHLISSPEMVTSNTTIELDPTGSYQVIIEPSKDTWFDDPRNALDYLINTSIGQTIVFIMFAFGFVGIIRLIFK